MGRYRVFDAYYDSKERIRSVKAKAADAGIEAESQRNMLAVIGETGQASDSDRSEDCNWSLRQRIQDLHGRKRAASLLEKGRGHWRQEHQIHCQVAAMDSRRTTKASRGRCQRPASRNW